MIELNNISFTYKTGEGTERGAAGGIGEKSSNGSLTNINLKIRDGEFLLLTGGSGCGKTTVLRLINGLIPNFFEGNLQGEILVDGKSISSSELYDTAKTVSTVFQNPRSQFFNVDTTSELAFACENQGMDQKEILQRINQTVTEMQLEPLMNRSLFELSGGQKQKIACASVAVTGNKIILLDEPSANLDNKSVEGLRQLLKKWKSEGKTIIVAEHRLSYLWDLADRAVVLKDGILLWEFDRKKMDSLTEAELHEMGLRTNRWLSLSKPPVKEDDNKMWFRQAQPPQIQNSSLLLQNFRYKYRNGYQALNIPKMEIPIGQITAITGNNGEGKTTFLNCLCGLGSRSKGTLTLRGKTCKRRARQKQIFLVMQDVNHQLFAETVIDEILISQKEENEDEALMILKSLDLLEFAHRHPQSLSGGQKQRVAVACAIASCREVLLFDEPTSGLDYTHMLQISQILKDLKAIGRTIIVVTHDRELINECCDTEIELKQYNKI